MSKLKIVYRQPHTLIQDAWNARQHSDEQVKEIAESITRFGFTNPVLVDEVGKIIAGHGRVLAASMLKLAEVPTIAIHNLSETERTALAIADNKIALNATWDESLLRDALERVEAEDRSIKNLGFSDDELRKLLGESDPIPVRKIETGPVPDTFWISVRGPLKDQARALKLIEGVLADLGEVDVQLGTLGFVRNK